MRRLRALLRNSQEKDRDTLRLAFIGVKNCRSRPHLWCAGLKARSTPADSQDC